MGERSLHCGECEVDIFLSECRRSSRRDGGTFYSCDDCGRALAVLHARELVSDRVRDPELPGT